MAAVATAPGAGAIGIVRLSGPASRDVLARLFRPARQDFTVFRPFTLHHGSLHDAAGRPLDDVLAVFMPGPRTFTGQDMAELHCHGSPAVLAEALAACCACGAREALPGEFSKRAFLAGRLDLTQAEAVAELVAAPSAEAARQALQKLSGALGEQVRELRARLVRLRAELCVAVDFPDDEVECLPSAALAAGTGEVLAAIDGLCASFARGRLVREGALVVLAGPVNAGKSSLLNALLGRERAIVSDAPGTTRDYIEETALLHGLAARLVDTAGLRETEDHVELEGVRRSRALLDGADLVLLVVDGARPLGEAEQALCREVGTARVLACLNKADLPGIFGGESGLDDPAAPLAALGVESLRVSARSGEGVSALAARCRERLLGSLPAADGRPAPNLRQARALEAAAEELRALRRAIDAALPYDLLAVHLDAACTLLAAVTGEIGASDVLEEVFSGFCIGK
ncbi:tRNA uridine-5-carboxymethylaminomethyl(34) synthesis GTPase MnmE [Desulfovibrio sp. X2]|uniref:tRNA uridine-5-carboxymethylaminomethyl(34) synthesis GTPase MnmE n=1 Tax=Desulfovibrio sp. X2 TaxID=941449 RepID=UPI000558AA06|nr:tRNA uridine-5-carboxymethylaminomethyl(34) synthesis GTPase MnmE [Desulfovibrio sp. X2]